jgi:asparagine synthase (glutamine-hydrolysing)
MCGVVALIHLDGRPIDPKLLRRMTATLAHRGPDGEDIWIEGGVGLGHRRLAVFDVSDAGRQPMLSADGRWVVSFNGALYDFKTHRAAMLRDGVVFRGVSDTEVLVNALEREGALAVERFNGIFAFAAYDRIARRVVLMRDRFGQKPLYVWRDGRSLIAASEIRAILAHPDVPKRINPGAIREYLAFQNIFRPVSMFDGVELLGHGMRLEIDLASKSTSQTRWWDFDFSRPDQALTFEDAAAESAELLSRAVALQCQADVPVGAYLSGGIDSSAITALAAPTASRLTTFTCGFDMSGVTGLEANFDERRQAEQLAAALHTRHYECVLTARDIPLGIAAMADHLEDLRMGMAYPNYFVAELAGRFVKVALSGVGGDELFGGYPWRYYRVLHGLGVSEFEHRYFAYWQRLIPVDQFNTALAPGLASAARDAPEPFEAFRGVLAECANLRFDTAEDQIAASLYFEARTFLCGLLLMQDRLSAAHGLEERAPFLDNDLAALAMRIPVRHKLANLGDFKRLDENTFRKMQARSDLADDGKNVLRHALEGILPAEVRARRKQGFSSPEGSWYRGEAMPYVRSRLAPEARISAFLRPEFVGRIVAEHGAGAHNHRLLIWSMLCLESWLERYFPELDHAGGW